MAITEDDKKFITSKLILALAGFFVAILASALIGAYVLSRALAPKEVKTPGPVLGIAAGLDTPVVLVGGSLTFNADSSYPWTLVSGNTYQVAPNYAIKAIVVNTDLAGGTDKLKVDISNASSWEVDEYIAGTPEVEVASITGVASNPSAPSPIYLKLVSGYLCPGPAPITAISYGIASGCPAPPPAPTPDPIKFSKVTITVNGQPLPSATLACYDSSDPQGTCRIVFRGH
jgi:hypothetical protein